MQAPGWAEGLPADVANLGSRKQPFGRGNAMKTKAVISALLAGCLLGALFVPTTHAAPKGKAKSGPQVVGTDDPADWGSNVDKTIAPAGNLLGQELVEASIEMSDMETVNFIIKLGGLPPTGGIPEGARYSWDFTVDGDAFSMSGNFTDYARGICYPAHSNSCPPPQDPGGQPFYVREGPCTIGTSGLSECNLVATATATFDTATATITVPVPLEAIRAKPGSKIGPGTNSIFGATIYATPAAVTANANGPHDTMNVLEEFVVASGKKATKKK